MSTERDDPRGRKIAEQLDGYLDEGEAFLVRCEEEEIRVYDAPDEGDAFGPPDLPARHPELYGRMLRTEEALDRAAGPIPKLLWLAALLLIVAIATGWLTKIVEVDVEPYQSFWVYLGIVIVTAVVTGTIKGFFARTRWRGLRKDILGAIDSAGLTVDTVLAALTDDYQISTLEARLKREPPRTGRYD